MRALTTLCITALLASLPAGVTLSLAAEEHSPRWEIPRLEAAHLLEMIREGRPIVFLDAREPEQFAAEHLPRAVHMTRHDLHGGQWQHLDRNAVIVPYCVKDFRGFGAAVDLVQLGFPHVALLAASGINGWKQQGWPLAGGWANTSDEIAWQRLEDLAHSEQVLAPPAEPPPRVPPTGEEKRFRITVGSYFFDPNELHVTAGDLVVLELFTLHDVHGVAFPELGLQMDLPERQTRTLTFLADRPGTFPFGCSQWCGLGHGQMKGTLVVRPSAGNQ